ncbi:GntR family transcriptional regulator [Streptomyces scopuliridis]|uniref:GntR family transcriptional regulator n=1 Tax=Streptomyces scopuliridis TaxID=452529 RepID=UPI0034241B40
MDTDPALTRESSKRETILHLLRRDIVTGAVPPGERLSEARLATRFGVSRMPVREALKELEREGFVAIEERRGTFVRSVSRSEILDLFEVREAVEGMAARLCAARANNSFLDRIDQTIAEMAGHVRVANSDGYTRADAEFHGLIVAGASNERLSDHYRLLIQHLHRGLLSSIVTRREGRMKRSLAEHREIVRALHAHSADKAETAMREHVRRGRLELQEEVSTKFGGLESTDHA